MEFWLADVALAFMGCSGEVIFNAQPQKARVAISCSHQRSRVYCLVLHVAQGPTLITRIAPQLFLTVRRRASLWLLSFFLFCACLLTRPTLAR